MHTNDPNNISELLHSIVSQEADLIHNRLRALGVNTQQARLLRFVSQHPGTIQKDVARYLNRQNATVTNMLKTMAAQGYLSRRIPVDNERQKQIFLEPRGQALIVAINRIFADLETQVKTALPTDQTTQLITNLTAIQTTLAALDK